MPSRAQTRIRRDLNRLAELIREHSKSKPALGAVATEVAAATELVNQRWQAYQAASVAAKKEQGERDAAGRKLRLWVQQWRPVVMLKLPGAAGSLRALPASGATADDRVRVAADLQKLIGESPAAVSFREAALAELGTKLEEADRERREADVAVPAMLGARLAFSELQPSETRPRGRITCGAARPRRADP